MKKTILTEITISEKCPCCNASYFGGHEVPNKKFKLGLRVFYDCGCSVSVKEKVCYGYLVLIKNCQNIN